ncbi:hypothetical protein [Auritidibacter ignavus]|uniref:hypothetical protein n=1 Tax=Auritidibacter ignavus TaxID=678932 RepID=UPI000F02A44C|nr:hypothetical protein [Auritidibacter ignavus]NIH70474.1 hypothetical protein [Auritidibacter ignavus]RMX23335.1 hypothetical protein DYI20_05565 [Auritidibacter ignavus]
MTDNKDSLGDTEHEIKKLAGQLAEGRAKVAQTRRDIDRAIIDAHEAGVSEYQLADWSGLARTTVRGILGK